MEDVKELTGKEIVAELTTSECRERLASYIDAESLSAKKDVYRREVYTTAKLIYSRFRPEDHSMNNTVEASVRFAKKFVEDFDKYM